MKVTPYNVGRYCLSEDDCIQQGIDFAAYERGVADATKALEANAARQPPAPAVELTDAELFDAIEADLVNKFWATRRAMEQDVFLSAARAAIAAHEARKSA